MCDLTSLAHKSVVKIKNCILLFLSAGGVINKNKILQTEETDLKCVAVINLTRAQNSGIELKF